VKPTNHKKTSMKNKTKYFILLTGGSGNLGSEVIKSKKFKNLVYPSKKKLNITKFLEVKNFLLNNNITTIIHCAALARMRNCENFKKKAFLINVGGTRNLVKTIIRNKLKIRFIYISSDAVYAGQTGNYSEKSKIKPINYYGLTKYFAEREVKKLKNYVIIRTRFFNKKKIKFKSSAIDSFSSTLEVSRLIKYIKFLVLHNYIGVLNIGSNRISDYDAYKKYKKIKPCFRKTIAAKLNFETSKDSSLDCSVFKKIFYEKKKRSKYYHTH